MRHRTLGRTGLEVSELGFGSFEIGWTPPEESQDYDRLLNRALDAGINFIDSSAAYRWSEEHIARYLGPRRGEFYFATKCGSGRVLQDDGTWVQTLDYSAAAITPQIDRSLQRLAIDCIDIVQLHSPPLDALVHGDGLDGLKKAQQQGKVRFICISADHEVAREAVRIGAFDTLQITYNIAQTEQADIIDAARAIGMGIIVKNPIVNALYEQPRPENNPELWDRCQQLLAPEIVGDESRVDVALRWLLSEERIDTAIVGTTNLAHLEQNIAAAERGPLPTSTLEKIAQRQTAISH